MPKKNKLIRLLKGYIRYFRPINLVGLVFILLSGGIVETMLMPGESFGFKEIVTIIFFCLPMFLAGWLIFLNPFFEISVEEMEGGEIDTKKREYQPGSVEEALQSFRERLKEYYMQSRFTENSPIQGFVTQSFFQILSLQKRRLENKGLFLLLETEAVNHSGKEELIPTVRERSYDDGKYKISQVTEQITGEKSYLREGKVLYRKKQNQIAEYTLLTAFQKGGNRVVCPSCGTITTRENLLDGCDFCKTKFILEDLGERVQSFSFGTDYEIQYSKYKKVQAFVWKWGAILGGIPGAALFLIASASQYIEVAGTEERIGIFIFLIATLFGMGVLGLVSAIAVFTVIWFLIFPIAQTIAGLSYKAGKEMKKAKEEAQTNLAAENAVRSHDVRFSLQGFYGSIKNKLAGIHFADTEQEINSFTDCDIRSYLPVYQSVIDIETNRMVLENYEIENDIQKAQVKVGLKLLSLKGEKIKASYEKIGLQLIKSASCKTQAVSGPEVIRCEGCGSSISLVEGKGCRFCGRPIPLYRYDWIINGYQVLK